MMKNSLLGLVVLLVVVALGVGKWYSNRTNLDPDPFWQASNQHSLTQIDHSDWQYVLDEYLVTDDPSGVNLVDYESLADEPDRLNQYINKMAGLDPRSLTRSEQFAYWVNLYNALTMQVVAKNYPVDSILKISSSGLPIGPWDDHVTTIQGKKVTLNDIEHRILRAYWSDHRIHFAVNCASYGCPNVQPLAFTVANTEVLLNSAATEFVSHSRGAQLTQDGLVLSSIFDWYASDFGDTEKELLGVLARYRPSLEAADAKRISYNYDWSLNDYK